MTSPFRSLPAQRFEKQQNLSNILLNQNPSQFKEKGNARLWGVRGPKQRAKWKKLSEATRKYEKRQGEKCSIISSWKYRLILARCCVCVAMCVGIGCLHSANKCFHLNDLCVFQGKPPLFRALVFVGLQQLKGRWLF